MKISIIFFAGCALAISVLLSPDVATRASAQDGEKANATVIARKGFQEVSGWITKSAEMVPAEKYDYKPVDTVRSFGQIIAHVADSLNYYCATAAGNKMEGEPAEKGKTDKATLLPKLKDAVDKCNTVYGSDTGKLEPLLENIGHSNLHYGNLITYLRMMGMKPPSS
jgi:uncharacterized damage-inducible protein DinB